MVDPAVTNGKTSDETGIVVLAQAFNGDIYIWHDKTGKYSPHEWAKLVRALFKHYHQHFPDTRIVCETNQGGDLVVSNLNSIDHDLTKHIDTIHASKGKLVRAETAAAKYQRGKVHHIGYFDKLERQMTNYTGDTKMGSPDAMDAMVHGINSLFVAPNFTVRDLSVLEGF
jgi:predicted phage terminase large subunit-like protein